MNQEADYEVRFTGREITAWGGLALMRRMLQGMKLSEAAKQWDLPQPCSNRGYEPLQIIEQFLVSIWCGANRFAHADINPHGQHTEPPVWLDAGGRTQSDHALVQPL